MAEASPMETGSLKRVRQLNHLDLLVALILLQVVQSFLTGATATGRIFFDVLFLGLVLATIRSFAKSRKRLAVAITLGAFAFCLSCVAETYPS